MSDRKSHKISRDKTWVQSKQAWPTGRNNGEDGRNIHNQSVFNAVRRWNWAPICRFVSVWTRLPLINSFRTDWTEPSWVLLLSVSVPSSPNCLLSEVTDLQQQLHVTMDQNLWGTVLIGCQERWWRANIYMQQMIFSCLHKFSYFIPATCCRNHIHPEQKEQQEPGAY